jgi:hypothetical protein
MSSDIPEANTPGPGRRSGRADGGAPVTGALTVVLAIVAVVAGFLILRSLSNDDSVSTGGPSTGGTETSVSTAPVDSTPITPAESTTTTTTEPELVTEGATVIVANANTVNGSAAAMTRELEAAGFTMGTPTNAAGSYGKPDQTVIYFDESVPAAQAVAESVGRTLGGVAGISPVAVPAPTESGELDGDVLVMLGNDKANKTLEDLQAEAAGGDTTESSAAPAVSAPDPAGTETTGG